MVQLCGAFKIGGNKHLISLLLAESDNDRHGRNTARALLNVENYVRCIMIIIVPK